jgi:hypothetical protein
MLGQAITALATDVVKEEPQPGADRVH